MPSKKRQLFLSSIMLSISVAITTLLYLNRPPTEIQEPVRTPITIDVAMVVKENIRIQVQAQGTVTPLRETSILSEVNGRIIEVSASFNVGGFVSQDDILLRIDPRDYETNLLRMQASIESAESNLAQERGRAHVAEREWKKLPKGSQRSQDAKDLYLRKPQMELAEAQLLAAKADLNTAQDNLDRTIIRAPYDALIRTKHSDLGKFVTAGTPLAELFSVEYAEVRLPIPQSKLDYLELPGLSGYTEGSPIDLYTDVGGELKHWTAFLHRTEGVYDERSRVLFAVARVEDPYGLHNSKNEPLRIGTFINADIAGKEMADIVPLPRYVLRAGNNLWVVDKDSRLRNRKVTLLRTGGDLIYVSAGLDNGDLVSLTTLDSSFDSTEVVVKSNIPSDQLNANGSRDKKNEDDLAEATTVADSEPQNNSGG
ncbi:MAG: RND family efflux transporter MFP subunit [Halioglobus sp.]